MKINEIVSQLGDPDITSEAAMLRFEARVREFAAPFPQAVRHNIYSEIVIKVLDHHQLNLWDNELNTFSINVTTRSELFDSVQLQLIPATHPEHDLAKRVNHCLSLLTSSQYADAILGDLHERYEAKWNSADKACADRWYRSQILRTVPLLVMAELLRISRLGEMFEKIRG